MLRPAFLPLLLPLACMAPLALAAVPAEQEAPSHSSRFEIQAWADELASRANEPRLPIWAVLGSAMLDFSGQRTAPRAMPRRERAQRAAAPRPRLAVVRSRIAAPQALRPASPRISIGALY